MEPELNVEFFYEMCLKELQCAQTNLSICTEKVTTSYKAIKLLGKLDETSEYLSKYDQVLIDLSHIAEIVRKFNIQVKMANFPNVSGDANATAAPSAKNNDNKTATSTPATPEKDCSSIVKTDEQMDTSVSLKCAKVQYKLHHEGVCIISHVNDASAGLFFAIDNSSGWNAQLRDLADFFKESRKPLSKIPGSGIVFGLFLDNHMFRVVRIGGGANDATKNVVTVKLIDVGEELEIPSDDDTNVYELSAEQQQIPVQAIQFRLVAAYDENEVEQDSVEYLKGNLYRKQGFVVANISNGVVDVYLFPHEEDTIANADQSDNHSSDENQKCNQSNNLSNPFAPFRCDMNNMTEAPAAAPLPLKPKTSLNPFAKSFECNDKSLTEYYNNPNNFTLPTSLADSNNKFWTEVSSPKKAVADSVNEMSEEDRNVLFEEPLNTQNALVASMGYNPQDDKRICPFFDPRIGGCFKGSSCRMEHVAKLKDGWTRDKAPFKLNNRCTQTLPPVGETVEIIPTHVQNVNTFYANIPSLNPDYAPTLKQITLQMNSTEIRAKLKPLTQLPGELELVLAIYKDNLWYRCKVLAVIDETHIKVFYLDYGNCHIVTLKSLCHWLEQFDFYPYQAYQCRLDNVQRYPDTNSDIDASNQLRNMILNRPLKANVTCNFGQLFVTLRDSEGFDIGEMLCGMNLALPKKVTSVASNQTHCPPL